MTHFKRVMRFEREGGTPVGVIRGVLATDGEVSDGHILSMQGAEVEPGIPLLFGHDAVTGDRNLGSWIEFTKSAHSIRGEAAIEMDGAKGSGTLEWRQDKAHMVAKGHITGLSIRWDPTAEPLRRTSLPETHPAFVDSDSEPNPMKRYGYFFPRWRALEGSLVNLGADRQAVTERCESAPEPLRAFWRSELLALDEQARAEELEALIARASQTPPELTPAPKAPQSASALVPIAEVSAIYGRVTAELLKKCLAEMPAEVRAIAAQEVRRARGV